MTNPATPPPTDQSLGSSDEPVVDDQQIRGEFDDPELLLHHLATAIVELSRTNTVETAAYAYPPRVQAAYNLLTLVSIMRGTSPPRSIPDMVRRAADQTLGEWPELDRLPDSAAASELLVDPETWSPSQLCLEWAMTARDVTAEWLENKYLHAAINACRAAGSPEAYTAFRRLLIQQPVLTQADWTGLADELLYWPVLDILQDCYRPAPASYQREEEYALCPGCNCLLVPVGAHGWRCELDRCLSTGSAATGERFRSVTPVYQLARPLRTFVTGPGLVECALRDQIEALGLDVDMWPNFDVYDLRVCFPDGHVWAIDVKDWASPFLLARLARSLPPDPLYHESFLVIPDYRTVRMTNYLEVLTANQQTTAAVQTQSQIVRLAEARLRTAKRGGTTDA